MRPVGRGTAVLQRGPGAIAPRFAALQFRDPPDAHTEPARDDA